jgi:alanine racemase
MDSPTRAVIDLGALRHNLSVIRERSGQKPLMAIVKANAYGHGALLVSRTLSKAGVDRFAVATLPEALELRRGGVKERILVLGMPIGIELELFERHNLELAIGSVEILEALLAGRWRISVHLEVDTGMTRLGISPSDAMGALRRLSDHPHLEIAAVFTHFSTADIPGDEQTLDQLARWKLVRSSLPAHLETHASASGGVFTSPDVARQSDVVRAGIVLYGLYEPGSDVKPEPLRPVMQLISRIARVQRVEPGTPVSYGGRWRAPSSGTVITVAAGYADGLPRRLFGLAHVGIGDNLLPVVGTICMDMCMAFTDDPEAHFDVGEDVVLWGPGGPSVSELALLADTIPYEIVCRVGSRVDRVERR